MSTNDLVANLRKAAREDGDDRLRLDAANDDDRLQALARVDLVLKDYRANKVTLGELLQALAHVNLGLPAEVKELARLIRERNE